MNSLKLTVYFVSEQLVHSQHVKTIQTVISQRDVFLKNNIDNIDEIIDEDISFELIPSHNSTSPNHIFAIMRFSYYPKNNAI